MKRYEAKWKVVAGSVPTGTYGEAKEVEPEQFAVDLHRLIDGFEAGFQQSRNTLEAILPAETFTQVEALTRPPEAVFDFPHELWVKVVYDFAVAYTFSSLDKSAIINALIPLYFGRTGSFVIETEVMSNKQAEEHVQETAGAFEELKPYLIARWDAAKARTAPR